MYCSRDHNYTSRLNQQYEKSTQYYETPYHLGEHETIYRKIRDRPNIIHAIMVPNTLQSDILYECHNALGHNGSTRLYHFISRHYYWKRLCQHCNTYVCSCSGCQQVALKGPQYVNLCLPIPKFQMSFISMDLVGPSEKLKTEICMH